MDIQGRAIERIPEGGNLGLIEQIFLTSAGTVIDMATAGRGRMPVSLISGARLNS